MNKYIGILILLLAVQFVSGQTTISNIPSTDVVGHESFYGEVNYSGHFGKYADGGFQTYGLKTIYGLRRNFEVGMNLTFTKNGGVSPVEVVPNIKWKVYFNEKQKVSISGGAMVFIPVKDNEGSLPSAFVYANASKGFDFVNGFWL